MPHRVLQELVETTGCPSISIKVTSTQVNDDVTSLLSSRQQKLQIV
jgi:hypothetical protein